MLLCVRIFASETSTWMWIRVANLQRCMRIGIIEHLRMRIGRGSTLIAYPKKRCKAYGHLCSNYRLRVWTDIT